MRRVARQAEAQREPKGRKSKPEPAAKYKCACQQYKRKKIPFEGHREARYHRGRRLVECLKKPAAENPGVNPRLSACQKRREFAVNSTEPTRLAKHVETRGMLEEQQSLSSAITALLFQIVANGVPAKMPDDGRRAETDLVAFVLESPTNIHVISRGAKNRIKSVNGLQSFAAKGHIASGDVFSDFIIQQHMGRRARRHRNAGSDQRIVRRRK